MIIHHHLGLGDHFVCNGIVNYFSQNTSIDLICKSHNLVTVQSLYCDNPNVSIVDIPGNNERLESYTYANKTHQQILYIGFENCRIIDWDKSFYQQVNLDFIERYRFFKLPRKLPIQIKPPNQPYIFVHKTSSDEDYNLNIDSKLQQFVASRDDTNNLLSYLSIIRNAYEIHCINSSIFHLIDSLSDITYNLYYHNIRKHPCSLSMSPKWKVVSYDQ